MIAILLVACGNYSNAILNKKNFDEGDWLIVISDENKRILFVIDDEKVLKENPYGLLLGPMAECGGTTCECFLELYKDGELITQQELLTSFDLIETRNIRKAYKIATKQYLYPNGKEDFNRQWDSLKKINKTYPTRHHNQPDDVDVICYYKYE